MGMDRLENHNSVLVVIDVQNDFCSPDGLMAKAGKDVSRAVGMIPRLQAVIAGAHAAGIPAVFVRTTHSDGTTSEPWRYRSGKKETAPNCVTGSWGAEFFSISPGTDDYVATKHRYSALTSPEFQEVLARLERSSLLFCGVATNICVETTLRDAVCADYFATLIEDCSAAYSERLHIAALENIRESFGLITNAETVLERWHTLTGLGA